MSDQPLEDQLQNVDMNNDKEVQSIISEHLNDSLHPVFAAIQEKLGATTGDISPVQLVYLHKAIDDISAIVLTVAKQNAEE